MPSLSKPDVLTERRLAELYGAHRARVHSVCLAYLHDPAAAEDAVQETFLRAGRLLPRLEDERLGAYLAATARNVCRSELRMRRSHRASDAAHRELEAVVDPAVVAADRDVIARVWSGLPVRDRALLLFRFAGYGYEEIARRTGASLDSVRMGLMHARRRARRLLERTPAGLAALLGRRRGRLRPRWRRRLPSPTVTPAAWWSTTTVAALATLAGLGPWSPPALRDERLAGSPAGVGLVASAASLAGAAGLPPGVRIDSIGASPAYATDGTLYASGDISGCAASRCTTLYVSRDRGRTWTRRPATGFAGGTLLVAAAPVLLVAGPQGLQRSDDGGGSFHLVAAVRGPAAFLGGTAAPVVVIGAQPLRIYEVRSETLRAGAWLPRGMAIVTGVAGLDDGRSVLVAAAAVPGPGAPPAGVLRCDVSGGCHAALETGGGDRLRLVRSATFDRDHAVAAVGRRSLALSRDGGTSFAVLDLHAAAIAAVGLGSDVRGGFHLFAAVTPRSGAGDLLVRLDGRGAVMPLATLPGPLALLQLTPAGEALRAPETIVDDRDAALECSLDDGRSWRIVC